MCTAPDSWLAALSVIDWATTLDRPKQHRSAGRAFDVWHSGRCVTVDCWSAPHRWSSISDIGNWLVSTIGMCRHLDVHWSIPCPYVSSYGSVENIFYNLAAPNQCSLKEIFIGGRGSCVSKKRRNSLLQKGNKQKK